MPRMKLSNLVFASSSREKYNEYKSLLGLTDLKLSEIIITEPQSMNLHYLAEEKIKEIRQKLLNTPFFVEHTGLIIDAWKGLPGGLTHVFMDTVGNEGILKMLSAYKGVQRSARAKVVIGYYHQSSGLQTFEGHISGTIARKPRGLNNFGWDPIFIPVGQEKTYAEMDLEEKNRNSMRQEAAAKFLRYLLQHFEL